MKRAQEHAHKNTSELKEVSLVLFLTVKPTETILAYETMTNKPSKWVKMFCFIGGRDRRKARRTPEMMVPRMMQNMMMAQEIARPAGSEIILTTSG